MEAASNDKLEELTKQTLADDLDTVRREIEARAEVDSKIADMKQEEAARRTQMNRDQILSSQRTKRNLFGTRRKGITSEADDILAAMHAMDVDFGAPERKYNMDDVR
jgi:hypothetical protein